MEELTQRQKILLDFLTAFQSEHGFPPTLAQMAQHLGVSSLNGVRGHLAALERKGCITKNPGESRAVAVKGWKRLLNVAIGRMQGRHGGDQAYGRVTYHLGWLTARRKPLAKAVATLVEQTIREIAAEHGWEVHALRMKPDRIELVLTVSPDHSPAAVVQHVRWFAGWERIKQSGLSGLKGLWEPGFAVGSTAREYAGAMAELAGNE